MPFAKIDTATSGDNTIVAAQTSGLIRVLSYVLVAAGAVTAQWKTGSGAGGSNVGLSGAMSLITGQPVVCPAAPMAPQNRSAYMETAAGELLNLNLGGNVQVSGHIEYEVRRV